MPPITRLDRWGGVTAALLVFLTGCAPVTDMLAPPYEPQPIRIFDKAQYQADVAECRIAGIAFKPQFSLGSAIAKTVGGATSNTSLIPVSPLVPVFGAAGGAVSATSDGLDVMSKQHSNVFKHCVMEITRRDGAAIVANPDD